jgi:flagellar motility protein MotE (MotC chaperone)
MIAGLRLIDGVIIAAVALLALKALGFFSAPRSAAPATAVSAASGAPKAGELPNFARVLAHARTNYVPPDVAVTGAVEDKEEKKNTGATAPEATGPAATPVAGEGAPQPASPSQRAILERLGERREELQQRAREIEMRERLLENAEKKLEGRINELKGLEDKADAAATKRGDTEAGAIRNLVTMYEAMKPKDAAKVFDRLPHEVLVPVVLQMKPAKMAEVLAVMTTEAAEKLTVALATRAKSLSAEARTPSAGVGHPPNELPSIDPPVAQQKR